MKNKATGNIRHIGIVVQDMDLMTNFYTDTFGFKSNLLQNESGPFISTILGHENIKVTTHKFLDEKGQCLELLFFPDKPKMNKHRKDLFNLGIAHMALTVSDIDSIYDKLVSQGISFISPIQYAPGNKVKVVFCEDPEGNYLELVEEL